VLPVSDCVDSLIGPTEFTISTLPPTSGPNFSFVGEVGKNVSNYNLDVKNIF